MAVLCYLDRIINPKHFKAVDNDVIYLKVTFYKSGSKERKKSGD